MRALVLSIWVFINLVFFGMCGYMYLLWSQYWMYIERQTETTTSVYDQQIYFYNRGYYPSDLNVNKTNNKPLPEIKPRKKHSIFKENSTITLIKNSKPRFPNLQPKDFEFDSKKYYCLKSDTKIDCDKKNEIFKDIILKEMRKVLMDEGNVLKVGLENPYNVHYRGVRGSFEDKDPRTLLCQFKAIPLNTLQRSDVGLHVLREFLPKRGLFDYKSFNSCAIIASAGGLKNSNLGKYIDSHNLVLRFNDAPTKNFEKDVGTKTTIRLLNSQVIAKPEFKFLESDMFKNVTLVAWDPSNYTSIIENWLKHPDFDLLPNYMEYRKRDPKSRFFLLNPHSLWRLWEFLQGNSPGRLRKNPPSSGFMGLRLLLPHCNFVNMFEYIPSVRVTKKCHYYDTEDNPSCTFGAWHPLAAEKLLTYHLNTVSDREVFQKGYVRVMGFRDLVC